MECGYRDMSNLNWHQLSYSDPWPHQEAWLRGFDFYITQNAQVESCGDSDMNIQKGLMFNGFIQMDFHSGNQITREKKKYSDE